MNLVEPFIALSVGSVSAAVAAFAGAEPGLLAVGSLVPLAILLRKDSLYPALILMPPFAYAAVALIGFPVVGLALATLPAVVFCVLTAVGIVATMGKRNHRAP